MHSRTREWQARFWGVSAFLVATAFMALVTSVVYGHDSSIHGNLRATRLAIVTAVNGSAYTYSYDTCTGTGSANPPPVVGKEVRIFYDPNAPCENAAYDPATRERFDLISLLVFSALFSLAVGSAAWDFARRR